MSFILDALRKSESERQQQNAPGIADLPQATARPSSRNWLWIVGVLLAINLMVVTGLLLRPEQSTDIESPVSSGAPGEISTEPQQQATERNELPVAVPQSTATADRAETSGRTAEPVQSEIIASPAPPANPPAARARVADGLETLNDLRARGILQLGDLHLDIHVYSAAPADRFVFINMNKYRENAALAEGPVVREITPDGVVLEHQDRKFLLPRE